MAPAEGRKMLFWKRWCPVAIVLVTIVPAAVSCGGDEGGRDQATEDAARPAPAGRGGSEEKTAEPDKRDGGCESKASDHCTPLVGTGEEVTVDGLTWEIRELTTASVLTNPKTGADELADGVFYFMTVSVRSQKNHAVRLARDVLQLEGRRKRYEPDLERTSAALGAEEVSLFSKDLRPGQMTTKVVFDVPLAFLKRKLKLRVNELGSGSTHGFIALPLAFPPVRR